MTSPWQVAQEALGIFRAPGRVWCCDNPMCLGEPHDDIPYRHARPDQRTPPGEWLTWLLLAGRGFGKTRTGAEDVAAYARRNPGARIALVGGTFTDGRDTMVEGESGLLTCFHDSELRGGSRDSAWNRSLGELYLANGSQFKLYSAEKPRQLRGPQHHRAWGDEIATWQDASLGDVLDTTWNNLMLGLRLGDDPRAVVTTTPKPVKLIKDLLWVDPINRQERPGTFHTRGTTYDNLQNLAPQFRERILAQYEGTRSGRQELLAEMLEDVEGALWSMEMIEVDRVVSAPDLPRMVVAVDPTGSNHEGSDEAGIVVAGRSHDLHGYLLADRSGIMSPHDWARRAVDAYYEFKADKIVAERNFGGTMVEETIRGVDRAVPVELVDASRGKRQRAEPISALYEQHRIHHVGHFPLLEDQMCGWVAGEGGSPDRMDALVWAFAWLKIPGGGQGQAFMDAWAAMREEAATRLAPVEPPPIVSIDGTVQAPLAFRRHVG